MRVLKWIIDRCQGTSLCRGNPLGWMPSPKDIDIEG